MRWNPTQSFVSNHPVVVLSRFSAYWPSVEYRRIFPSDRRTVPRRQGAYHQPASCRSRRKEPGRPGPPAPVATRQRLLLHNQPNSRLRPSPGRTSICGEPLKAPGHDPPAPFLHTPLSSNLTRSYQCRERRCPTAPLLLTVNVHGRRLFPECPLGQHDEGADGWEGDIRYIAGRVAFTKTLLTGFAN